MKKCNKKKENQNGEDLIVQIAIYDDDNLFIFCH